MENLWHIYTMFEMPRPNPCELNSQFSGNSKEFSKIPNYANDPCKLNSQFSGNFWEFLGIPKNS